MTSEPDQARVLEVVCAHVRDVAAATEGGADRLLLVDGPASGGATPSPAAVSAAARESEVPLRVLLRDDSAPDRAPTDQASADHLVARARELLAIGATSVAIGFLDDQLEVDVTGTAGLARVLGVPWGFHRGFDDALSADRAWRDVRDLPGLESVTSGGAARGLPVGGEELMRRASGDARLASLVLAAGDLRADQVPWLVRAGVRRLQLGPEVREDGSWHRSDVSVERVRAWRLLLDDACDLADGVPVG
ncbi:copper homeostasis protein CutC [Marmoricola endophyticus]|uniref:Copper homeostasis protein cutC homolog n=1 Tax=Marmoricola endophyticus TaxID=2040280 RepID=A0A917BR56_9ACTN|nr:copper homeostasis protein CutC [Marmoricola endophyticus]GGF53830.1 copper homeostasis protein CutC [Marmoricola endophyticus]